jgi:protease I
MQDLTGKKVAILATNGFEQSELTEPRRQLAEAGAKVSVVSPKTGQIRGWNETDWGDAVPVDIALGDATVDDYDALVLPGGQINPDILRANEKAVAFVRDFRRTGKPLAAICHAPWILIEADLVDGRRMTFYHSIRKDVMNAGATWVDEPVVTDDGLITSRNRGDLDAFSSKIAEEINERPHRV